MPTPSISVVIPLYNKEDEIAETLRSVLAQRLQPLEILVINDGSTDGSREQVLGIGSPLIRLIDQPNGGVCTARNRGIEEASGEYIALLDGDDCWEPGFLEEIASLITQYPDCGLYATGFAIVNGKQHVTAPAPAHRGIVGEFFRESAHRYIAIPSACCIPRRVFDSVGYFPEGMKIGEDLHMWIRIARRFPVCFSPLPLVRYSRSASNRSASIYTPEKSFHSFESLYDPQAPIDDREFIARAALGKALIQSAKGGTREAARAARFFSYTRTYRRTLIKVRILNSLPVSWRSPLLSLYNRLAWRIARKGV